MKSRPRKRSDPIRAGVGGRIYFKKFMRRRGSLSKKKRKRKVSRRQKGQWKSSCTLIRGVGKGSKTNVIIRVIGIRMWEKKIIEEAYAEEVLALPVSRKEGKGAYHQNQGGYSSHLGKREVKRRGKIREKKTGPKNNFVSICPILQEIAKNASLASVTY